MWSWYSQKVLIIGPSFRDQLFNYFDKNAKRTFGQVISVETNSIYGHMKFLTQEFD